MNRRAIDDRAVATFLATKVGAVDSLVGLAGDEWSQAFAFDGAAGHYVARFGLDGEDHAKDAVAAGGAGPDLPVPGMVEMGEAFEMSYAITERATGVLDLLDADGWRLSLIHI